MHPRRLRCSSLKYSRYCTPPCRRRRGPRSALVAPLRRGPHGADCAPWDGTSGRLAALGATLDFHHGPLAARLSQQAPLRTPDIHFTPTDQPVADAMLRLARVTPDDVVYDLGSGDGRIPILAAQKYGARGVGIELDPRLVALSKEVAREGEVSDRVTF